MKINEYRKLRRRTESSEQTVPERLANYAMGKAGETGEVVDIIKKMVFHGHSLEQERANIVKELGDDFWYTFGLMDLLDISIEEVLQGNIDKLMKRYPDGFSTEKSVNRES